MIPVTPLALTPPMITVDFGHSMIRKAFGCSSTQKPYGS
jgi:hypothetical protein